MQIVGGYYGSPQRPEMMSRAVEMIRNGEIRVEPLITHRYPFRDAPAAYDHLYYSPHEALGVLLIWQ